jgi:uncharacterized protein (TIGR00369 family)
MSDLAMSPADAAAVRMRENDGIDLYRQFLAGGGPRAPMADLMNITLVEVVPGRIVFESLPERRFYNPMGTIHGGYFGTLLDTAMGCAVQTMLKRGFGYTTIEYKVTLIRPMTEKTGTVRVEGRSIHVGKRVGSAEGRIVDAAGTIYAHGTTTCMIVAL